MRLNPLSLPSVSQAQAGYANESQAVEFAASYDRNKKIEQKRATEIAIQKVANIIANNQTAEEPAAKLETMEIPSE